MKHSTRLADAVHVLIYIHLDPRGDLRSTAIATSLATNPAAVRQIMTRLRRASLLTSVPGHARPALAQPPEAITLLDVYRAMDGTAPLLHLDTHTNPHCGAGVNIQLALQEHYDRIQEAAEAQMQRITIAQIVADYRQRTAGLTLEVPPLP
ncbi:Rrf2 family transcriptional regulator [Actinomyces sp. MRS3W]|uniref:Rrf2 family transcriptional regulator n=1 Tax=Actinomyces sp. MRS3W TaxID=2800796 RepID=UPI0028FDBCD0|nr:Rrf2 family transcriptional regulator [Actinomyces sp. MRS3W]MDU0348283.1 Rrf2 family transcriptional regulator [Actinomyces sp. MRS3W]